MKQPAKTVHGVHFEDFSGPQFERLVFAYHARTETWQSLEWYGQVGSDLGRDIWGVRDDGTPDGESVCIQCANRKSFTFAKAAEDIGKVLLAPNGTPVRFRIVARGNISANMRDRIRAHASAAGIPICDIWSGSEFEEFLRSRVEALLKRFVGGEEFPDATGDLKILATLHSGITDKDALALLGRLFDRPAFYTPIHQESNLGDFKQAITDTIHGIGTGVWRSRDGVVLGHLRSRHDIKDSALARNLRDVEIALTQLRSKFDDLVTSGVIQHCKCGDAACQTYFMPPHAARDLERLRENARRIFESASAAFCHKSGRSV
jgi:hypothetical protein